MLSVRQRDLDFFLKDGMKPGIFNFDNHEKMKELEMHHMNNSHLMVNRFDLESIQDYSSMKASVHPFVRHFDHLIEVVPFFDDFGSFSAALSPTIPFSTKEKLFEEYQKLTITQPICFL